MVPDVDIPHLLTPEIIQGMQADDSSRVGHPSAYHIPYVYSYHRGEATRDYGARQSYRRRESIRSNQPSFERETFNKKQTTIMLY
jgi:hypothetical protein